MNVNKKSLTVNAESTTCIQSVNLSITVDDSSWFKTNQMLTLWIPVVKSDTNKKWMRELNNFDNIYSSPKVVSEVYIIQAHQTIKFFSFLHLNIDLQAHVTLHTASYVTSTNMQYSDGLEHKNIKCTKCVNSVMLLCLQYCQMCYGHPPVSGQSGL